MKKHVKRMISAILVFCLLLTTVPLAGFAELELFPKAQAYAVGDHIQFGTYPQSLVTDDDLINKLDSIEKCWRSFDYYCGTGDEYDGKMTPDDYMKFADFFYGTKKYRAVTFSEFRPIITGWRLGQNSCVDNWLIYNKNTVYYFEYEPIEWRVLDPLKGLILCELVIDAQAFNNNIYMNENEQYLSAHLYYQDSSCKTFASDYSASSIRAWLNYNFLNTAFTDNQKQAIAYTILDNSSVPYDEKFSYSNSRDKVFLLSVSDATNSEYGFASADKNDNARKTSATQYAWCQGVKKYDLIVGRNYSDWLLRTPSDSRNIHMIETGYVSSAPYIGLSGTDDTSIGIRPACVLSELKSDISLSQNLFSESDEKKDNVFCEKSYIADIWLNRHEGFDETIESREIKTILSLDSLSTQIYDSLKNNAEFQRALTLWNGFKGFFDPVEAAEDAASKKTKLYEALIFDLLEKTITETGTQMNNTVKDAINISSQSASWVTAIKNAVDGLLGLTADPATELLPLLKSWKNGTNNSSYQTFIKRLESVNGVSTKWENSDFIKGIGFIAETAEDITDFLTRVSNFALAVEMSDEMCLLLSEMKKNTDNVCFKLALQSIINAMGDVNYVSIITTLGLSQDLTFTFMKEVFNEVTAACPWYTALRAGYQFGVVFDNIMFNTSDSIDSYYLMETTKNFIDANKKAISSLAQKYCSSGAESDAGAYVYAMKTYQYVYEIDLESTLEYVKNASKEGVVNWFKSVSTKINNFIFGTDTKITYDEVLENKEQIMNSLSGEFYLLQNSWKLSEQYLKNDYPSVYLIYAEEEYSKDVYTPSLLSLKLNKKGETELYWKIKSFYIDEKTGNYMPLYGSAHLNGLEVKETAGGVTNVKKSDNASNPVSVLNSNTFSSFPKEYSVSAYVNTSLGEVHTKAAEKKMDNPLKNPTLIPLVTDDGINIGILDLSSSAYSDIIYQIYRKTATSDFEKISSVNRANLFGGYYTMFTDVTAKESTDYTYMVVSELSFSNGLKLKSEQSNQLYCKKTQTAPSDIPLNVADNRVVAAKKASTITAHNGLFAAPSQSPQSDGISIFWSAVEGATGYEIYRRASYGTVYRLLATLGKNETSYNDEEHTAGMDYAYVVIPYYNTSSGTIEYDLSVRCIGASTPCVLKGHVWGGWQTKKSSTDTSYLSVQTCNYRTQQYRTCAVCGAIDAKEEKSASHNWKDPRAEDPVCTVCGYRLSELKSMEHPDHISGDVDNDGKVTAADARLALRRAVDLETYPEGSAEYLACDVDKDGKVTASDARIILRVAVGLETL